jgi:hypothetical protein
MFPSAYFPTGYFLSGMFPVLPATGGLVLSSYFPTSFFDGTVFPSGYFPGISVSPSATLTTGIAALWQFVYEGNQRQFVNGYSFSVAYAISDFFGSDTPAPDNTTSIVLVASDGTMTSPILLIRASSPPSGTQIVMATFPAMARGSYLVLPQFSLNRTTWASASPDRIEVI